LRAPRSSAFFTAASSFCMPIGFSRKSSAPIRVASTAVSIVAWPDIITTGMLSWPLPRPFLEQRDAIGIRHPDVEQDQVGTPGLARRARLGRILGELHVMALVAQDFRQQLAYPDLVIDHQYLRHVNSLCTGSAAVALTATLALRQRQARC
jgi:hypothetical protein